MTNHQIDARFSIFGFLISTLSIIFAFSASYALSLVHDGVSKIDKLLSLKNIIIIFFISALLSFCLKRAVDFKKTVRIYLYFLVIFSTFVLLNIKYDFYSLMSYGDAGYLPMVVAQDHPFSRWLAGTFGLSYLYNHLNFSSIFPSKSFVQLSGASCMIVASFIFALISKGRFSIFLPITTPIWLIFSSGYDEYYPFITGMFLAFIILMEKKKMHASLWIPVFSAALPLMYIGFAPFGAIVLIKYLIVHKDRRFYGLFVSLFFYFAGLQIMWPEGVINYLPSLLSDLNLGEKNTGWPPYLGKSSSPTSPFFKLSYAFHPEHLLDLMFMLFYGMGGTVIVFLFLFKNIYTIIEERYNEIFASFKKTKSYDLRLLIFAILFLWQIFYFIFMIPKLGPILDIDLFFSFYLTFSYLIGLVLDRHFSLMEVSRALVAKYYLLCFVVPFNFAIASILLFVGIN